MRQWLLPVSRWGLVLGLLLGLAVLGWSVYRDFCDPLRLRMGRTEVPELPASRRPVGRASEGWATLKRVDRWLDSLRHDSAVRRGADSLMRVRPGLRDSTAAAEEFYLQESKKK